MRKSKTGTGWLVFDNAITLEALPLPQTKRNQHLLITSRNEDWTNKRAVGTFSDEEAVTFIRHSQPHASEADCKALAQRLGHLPLALNQATAYLTEQSQSIPEYLSHLSEQGLGATMAQTWAVSLATIEAQSPAGNNPSFAMCTPRARRYPTGPSKNCLFNREYPCALKSPPAPSTLLTARGCWPRPIQTPSTLAGSPSIPGRPSPARHRDGRSPWTGDWRPRHHPTQYPPVPSLHSPHRAIDCSI